MKRTLSAILIITMILSLCSCTIGVNNTRLTMGILDEITTLDPVFAQGDGEEIISTNCFEGLLRFDADGKIDLAGATAYTLEKDSLSYTFKLNPEAQWYISDNVKATLESLNISDFDEKITAEDYVYGIKKFIESGRTELNVIEGASKYDPQNPEAELGVEALDEYTLRIKLQKTDPDFLYKLAALPVYPCEKAFYEALEGIYCSTPSTTLSNGPYYIKEVTPSEAIIERNPDYNGNIQTLNKSICLYSTGKQEALVSRFEDGSYDIVLLSSSQAIKGEKPVSTAVTDIWGIAFNCSASIGSNAKIRSLLLGTINYSEIKLPAFSAGTAKKLIPASYTVGDDIYSAFETDEISYKKAPQSPEEKLNEILYELNTEILSVKFAVPEEMSEPVQEMIVSWQSLFGDKLNVELIHYDSDNLNELIEEPDYDFAIAPLTPELNTGLSVQESVSDFPCYCKSKKLTALKKKIKNTEDNIEYYEKAEKLIVNKGIFVPLFHTKSKLYSAEGVSGVYMADAGKKIYFHSGEKAEQ